MPIDSAVAEGVLNDTAKNRNDHGNRNQREYARRALPGEWPVMLIEIFYAEDGKISMTCALGVPKSSLKAYLDQGRYYMNSKSFRPRSSGSSMSISSRSKRTSRPRWTQL